MNSLVLACFVFIFELINCVPAGWIDTNNGDTKIKLVSLLSSSNGDIYDSSVSNKVLIKPPHYEPFYKSKYQFDDAEEEFKPYQPNTEEFNKNGKFAIPWLENSKAVDTEQYDSSFEETPRHYDLKHGFYQGLWFHHRHPGCFPFGNRHRPSPPVHPTTPTTVAPSIDPRASTSAEIIGPNPSETLKPTLSTTSTERAGIDIRLGTDDDEADRIIFPDD